MISGCNIQNCLLSSSKKPLSRSAKKLLIAITALFLLLTLVKTFYLSSKYGGTDLRCRIVGARLLGTHHTPYFYQWQPGDDTWYLDPNAEAHRVVNGNVVTPATLAVIYPLSQLSYPYLRLAWTILQVLAAFAILFLLFRSGSFADRFLAASPVIVGLICSDTWFYHIERGQMYIFYAFFLALMYACYISRWKYNEFVSGFIGGLFILFRPFAGIIGLGFLLHGKIKWVMGCMVGFIIGCLLFVAPFTAAWKDYFKAMNEYVNENIGKGHTVDRQQPGTPLSIEGATNIKVSRSFNIDKLDTSYHLLKRIGIEISSVQSLLMYGFLVLVLAFFLFRWKKKTSSPESLFLFGFLLLILAELFVPAPRGSYNVIQWIFPLSLILLRSRRHLPTLIILGTGLLLLFHDFPFRFNLQGHIGELIFLSLTLYYIYFPAFNKTRDGIGRTG